MNKTKKTNLFLFSTCKSLLLHLKNQKSTKKKIEIEIEKKTFKLYTMRNNTIAAFSAYQMISKTNIESF
jgi:hypothetical protein